MLEDGDRGERSVGWRGRRLQKRSEKHFAYIQTKVKQIRVAVSQGQSNGESDFKITILDK